MENEINSEEKSEMELFEEYCKEIGVSFGSLFFHNRDTKIRLYISTEEERNRKKSLFLDKDAGNAHMTPDDTYLAELCSAYIYEKGTTILKCIEEIKKQ